MLVARGWIVSHSLPDASLNTEEAGNGLRIRRGTILVIRKYITTDPTSTAIYPASFDLISLTTLRQIMAYAGLTRFR